MEVSQPLVRDSALDQQRVARFFKSTTFGPKGAIRHRKDLRLRDSKGAPGTMILGEGEGKPQITADNNRHPSANRRMASLNHLTPVKRATPLLFHSRGKQAMTEIVQRTTFGNKAALRRGK